jgi:hypothetical protein
VQGAGVLDLGRGVLASGERAARRWRCRAEKTKWRGIGDAGRRPRAAALGMQGRAWLRASIVQGEGVLASSGGVGVGSRRGGVGRGAGRPATGDWRGDATGKGGCGWDWEGSG